MLYKDIDMIFLSEKEKLVIDVFCSEDRVFVIVLFRQFLFWLRFARSFACSPRFLKKACPEIFSLFYHIFRVDPNN